MTDFLGRFGQWGMVAGAAEGIGAAFCEELDDGKDLQGFMIQETEYRNLKFGTLEPWNLI